MVLTHKWLDEVQRDFTESIEEAEDAIYGMDLSRDNGYQRVINVEDAKINAPGWSADSYRQRNRASPEPSRWDEWVASMTNSLTAAGYVVALSTPRLYSSGQELTICQPCGDGDLLWWFGEVSRTEGAWVSSTAYKAPTLEIAKRVRSCQHMLTNVGERLGAARRELQNAIDARCELDQELHDHAQAKERAAPGPESPSPCPLPQGGEGAESCDPDEVERKYGLQIFQSRQVWCVRQLGPKVPLALNEDGRGGFRWELASNGIGYGFSSREAAARAATRTPLPGLSSPSASSAPSAVNSSSGGGA